MAARKKAAGKLLVIASAGLTAVCLFALFVPLVKPEEIIVPAIYQVLQDYQDDSNGGNGWMRLYIFKPAENAILVRTYSPYLDEFEVDDDSEFKLPYEMNGTEEFTIVVLPDTQYYSASYPEIFNQQTQWIVNNRYTYNIVFVIHLGDIVDNYTVGPQWTTAQNALGRLKAAGIPYSVLAGNHDFNPENPISKITFQTFFGSQYFVDEPWYGGSMQSDWYGGGVNDNYDDNANNYCFLDMGAEKYLILSLQYRPDEEILEWANSVIDAHPDYKVIVATHEYLEASGVLPGQRTSFGYMIFRDLVWPHRDQVFLVLCGHYTREDIVIDYIQPELFFLWWL